jgi:hypothetical protein
MKTPEGMARELMIEAELETEWEHPRIAALLSAWRDEFENEAYDRGYNNGYARQKHDRDWDKVEVNL